MILELKREYVEKTLGFKKKSNGLNDLWCMPGYSDNPFSLEVTKGGPHANDSRVLLSDVERRTITIEPT